MGDWGLKSIGKGSFLCLTENKIADKKCPTYKSIINVVTYSKAVSFSFLSVRSGNHMGYAWKVNYKIRLDTVLLISRTKSSQ